MKENLKLQIIAFIILANILSFISCDVCTIKAECQCISNDEADKNAPVKLDLCDLSKNNNNTTSIKKYTLNCTEVYNNGTKLSDNTKNPDANVFKLDVQYPCVVPPEKHSSYSTGTILVIIFFTVVFSYLGLGISVNFFLIGARGIEMLPHLDFWKDFPALVLDGVKFLQNGCKARPSDLTAPGGAEGYDTI